MKQYNRDQLGNNPFNVTNTPISYILSDYDNQVKYKHTILVGLLTLTAKASNLLLYMTDAIVKDKDYIYLDKKMYMENEKVKSRITAKSAIDELIAGSYITPTGKKDWYWLNPHKIVKL